MPLRADNKSVRSRAGEVRHRFSMNSCKNEPGIFHKLGWRACKPFLDAQLSVNSFENEKIIKESGCLAQKPCLNQLLSKLLRNHSGIRLASADSISR